MTRYLDGKEHAEYIRRITTPEALALSDVEWHRYAKRVREELRSKQTKK